MTDCPKCAAPPAMAFECVDCCLRWLSKMSPAEFAINAPVIRIATSDEHFDRMIGARAAQLNAVVSVDEQRKNIRGLVRPAKKPEAAAVPRQFNHRSGT